MKYGAMNFPIIPLQQEIDTFGELGFDYIEIAMDPPMAHHSIIAAEKQTIIRRLNAHQLGVVVHLPTFVTTADLTESLRRASLEEMRASLRVAAELGTEKVVLHPSMVFGLGGYVLDTVKQYGTEFVSEMVEEARSLGVRICMENMMPNNLLGVEPEDFRELFAAFPDLKLTIDTGHAHIMDYSGNRLWELVERFATRIDHLHFSDNNGHRDEHLALGKGTIPFKKLCRKIKTTGYDDTLTLEIFDTDRRELLRSRNFIKKLWDK